MGLEQSIQHSYHQKQRLEHRLGSSRSLPLISQALVGLNDFATQLHLSHVTPEKLKLRGTRLAIEARHARHRHRTELPTQVHDSTDLWPLTIDGNSSKNRHTDVTVRPGEPVRFRTQDTEPFAIVLHPALEQTERRALQVNKKPVVIEKKKTVINMEAPQKETGGVVVLRASLPHSHARTTETVVIDTTELHGKRIILEAPYSFSISGVGAVDLAFPIELQGNETVRVIVKPYAVKVKIRITNDIYGSAWSM